MNLFTKASWSLPVLLLASLLGCKNASQPVTQGSLGVKASETMVGPCRVKVMSFSASHLRIETGSEACDYAAPPLLPKITEQADKLMKSYPEKADALHLEIYLPYSPTLMKKCAAALENSPEWSQRPKPNTAVNSTNFPILVKLINQKGLFDSLNPLFARLGYALQGVEIEKVDYEAPLPTPMSTRLLLVADKKTQN